MPVRRVSPSRQPWNKGLLVGQKKPLEPKHVWSIRVRLEIAGSKRDLVIFNLAIFCSLDGTPIWIRALRSSIQVCEHRGGRGILESKQF
jgi:hypothetical protein